MIAERFRFGLFEFDRATGELRREGVPVHLPVQPARALALLLAQAGRLVSRETLRQTIWGHDTHVDFDRGLNFCIGQIRAALGDDSSSPGYIRTVAKRGYEFIAPVERMGDTIIEPVGQQSVAVAPADAPYLVRASRASWVRAPIVLLGMLALGFAGAWWLHAARTPKRPPIVAVYRFDNQSADPALSRFSDALTDNVVEQLTAQSGGHYAVIGNARILRLPRDERDLRSASTDLLAAYAVLGQVESVGSQTRILAHLIRLPDQTHLWVFRQDYALGAPVGVESEAAQRIAAEFGLRLIKDSSGKRLPPLPNR